MYLSKDGLQIFDCKPEVFDGEKFSIHPDTFECDPLMVPVVSTLLLLGFRTNYCCQGHLYTHLIMEDWWVKEYWNCHHSIPPLSACEYEPAFTTPYISFDGKLLNSNLEACKFDKLPDGWCVEYCHKNPVPPKDGEENYCPYMYNSNPPKDDEKKFNIVIRGDYDYVLELMKTYKFKTPFDQEDHFAFNRVITKMIEDLFYKWVFNLNPFTTETKKERYFI